jgi:hypothetical protein
VNRLVESEAVADAIARHPLTGSGFGATITWGEEDVFATRTTVFTHNAYLWLSWKIGIPAAALIFLAILAAVVRRRPIPYDWQLRALRTGSQAALLGLLIICITFPAVNALGITAVIGLLVAAALQPWPSPPPAPGRIRDPRPG